MQLIAEETADFSVQLFLDVGAERIAPLRAADRIKAIRILLNLQELVNDTLALCPLEMSSCTIAVHPAIFADLDPVGLSVRINR